jgi:RNA polymerase sigma-70 factor (ECF subfamily)
MAEVGPQGGSRRPERSGAAESPSDTQLVRRFVRDRDEQAFAVLVERHAALVLSVCRRVLGTADDPEDVAQATFLVLARRAGRLRDPGRLGNWLYGVAWRLARKARIAASRRRQRERPANGAFYPATAVPGNGDDVRRVLAEEVRRLPAALRAAVGLCYLEGKSNTEAARLLRWPVGTVKGRLARARALLRGRLTLRGLAPFALLLAVQTALALATLTPYLG